MTEHTPLRGGSAETADLRDEEVSLPVTAGTPVFSGRIWDVRSETFHYGDSDLTREFVDHPGAAAVVAVDDERRVLLIQQYRHPIRCRDWELPAGLLDKPGEPPIEAARRELTEEADLEAVHWEELLTIYPTPGGSNEAIHIFLATGLRSAPHSFTREGEEADLRWEWVPLSDAADAVLSGRMRNGALVAGVLAAERCLGAWRGA